MIENFVEEMEGGYEYVDSSVVLPSLIITTSIVEFFI